MAQSNPIPRLSATIPPAFRLLGCLALAAVIGTEAMAEKVKWEPAEEVRKTVGTPLVPGCDAEILLVELHVRMTGLENSTLPSLRGSIRAPAVIGGPPNRVSSGPSLTLSTPETIYQGRVRVMIYGERGPEAAASALHGMLGRRLGPVLRSLDPRWKQSDHKTDEIEAFGARLLKSDGRLVELDQGALDKGDGQPDGSFVPLGFPEIAAGDMVEFSWRFRMPGIFSGVLDCQRAIPVRDISVTFAGLPLLGASAVWRNSANGTVERKGNDLVCRASGILPEPLEPFSLPPLDVHTALILNSRQTLGRPKELWLGESTQWIKRFDESCEPTSGMRAKARELIEGLDSDEARLRRLYDYCQTEFENIDWSRSPKADEARAELLAWGKKPLYPTPDGIPVRIRRHSAEMVAWAWKRRLGDGELINLIFTGMARSVGLSVQPARCTPNTETRSLSEESGWMGLHRRVLVSNTEQGLRYVEPGSYFLRFGMLDAPAEDVRAFRLSEGKVEVAQTPVAQATQSRMRRRGQFTLARDGALEGEVAVRMTGHVAMDLSSPPRERGYMETTAWEQAAEGLLQRMVLGRELRAEMTKVRWSEEGKSERELVTTFAVRIPGYAKAADGRLTLAPAVFANLHRVAFPSAERKTDVCFPYAWQELDEIEIALPVGYELENPSAPALAGDGGKALGASYQLEYRKRDRVLVLKRLFTLGGSGAVVVPVQHYPKLKRVTDQLNASDAHVVVLRPVASGATTANGVLPGGG